MRQHARWLGFFFGAILAMSLLSVSAQDAPLTYVAHIHAGTCATPGEVIATLTNPTSPAGSPAGSADVVATANSYTSVPTSLDALLATPSVIDIHPSGDETVLACGEIAGVRDGSGALIVGLSPTSNSGLSGIAYLSPLASDPGQTGISTFLAATGMGGDAATPIVTTLEPDLYVPAVRAQVTLVVDSLQRVDALFGAPLPSDPAWLSQVDAEVALWQLVYAQAQQTVPPAEYADFHQRLLAPLALLDSAAMDVRDGLANGDQALLTEADRKISEAIAALQVLATPTDEATPAAG